jgi:hypothetical protein
LLLYMLASHVCNLTLLFKTLSSSYFMLSEFFETY